MSLLQLPGMSYYFGFVKKITHVSQDEGRVHWETCHCVARVGNDKRTPPFIKTEDLLSLTSLNMLRSANINISKWTLLIIYGKQSRANYRNTQSHRIRFLRLKF